MKIYIYCNFKKSGVLFKYRTCEKWTTSRQVEKQCQWKCGFCGKCKNTMNGHTNERGSPKKQMKTDERNWLYAVKIFWACDEK